jgi:hypothetical protein
MRRFLRDIHEALGLLALGGYLVVVTSPRGNRPTFTNELLGPGNQHRVGEMRQTIPRFHSGGGPLTFSLEPPRSPPQEAVPSPAPTRTPPPAFEAVG